MIKCHKSWSNAKRSIIVLRVKQHVALHFKKYLQIIYLFKIVMFAFFLQEALWWFLWEVSRLTPLHQYKTTRIASAKGGQAGGFFEAWCLVLRETSTAHVMFPSLFQPSNPGIPALSFMHPQVGPQIRKIEWHYGIVSSWTLDMFEGDLYTKTHFLDFRCHKSVQWIGLGQKGYKYISSLRENHLSSDRTASLTSSGFFIAL